MTANVRAIDPTSKRKSTLVPMAGGAWDAPGLSSSIHENRRRRNNPVQLLRAKLAASAGTDKSSEREAQSDLERRSSDLQLTNDTSDDELESRFRSGHAFLSSAAFDLPDEEAVESERASVKQTDSERASAKMADSSPDKSASADERVSRLGSIAESEAGLEEPTRGGVNRRSRAPSWVSDQLPRKLKDVPTRLSVLASSIDQVFDPGFEKDNVAGEVSKAKLEQPAGRLSNLLPRFTTQASTSMSTAEALAERSDAPKHGDPKRAYAASLMRRCVKKTTARRKGRYIDATGCALKAHKSRI